jgi:hypothetical protein
MENRRIALSQDTLSERNCPDCQAFKNQMKKSPRPFHWILGNTAALQQCAAGQL